MESFIAFLSAMPFWYWWVFAVALLTIELMTGSTYFLWPAIAAALAGVLALLPFSTWQAELISFAVVTIALSIFAPAYVKPWIHKSQADHLTLNERGAQKVGKRAVVESAFVNGAGKVRFGDTLWLAESDSGENFKKDAMVEITHTEGIKLFVKMVG